MVQPAPNTDKMNEHLLEVVRVLHAAVKQGVSHANEPKVMDQAIADCKEILDEIMKGNVKEWLN